MPEWVPDKAVARMLLRQTGSYGIVLRYPDKRLLITDEDMPPKVDATFDLRVDTHFGWITDAFMALAQTENRMLRIVGTTAKAPGVVFEVILDEMPMRYAMYDYSRRILGLSIVISLFTAMLVYLSLQWLIVRPMRRITSGMERFRQQPEDETHLFEPSGRQDEVGIAQRELAVMQQELRTALRQKENLAMLGAAVAKVNHDLRNSLATAMLIGDKIATSDDPEVQRMVPRLFNAIDHAVNLCSQTLNYATRRTPPIHARPIALAAVVDAAGEGIAEDEQGGKGPFAWRNEVPADLVVLGDEAQLRRVFENLGRNARQAGAGAVRVAARLDDGGRVAVEVADDGPGMPDKARENLFRPFAGSVREGGTGLGLVIARDILRAHGGDITLRETGADGTTFRLDLSADPSTEKE